MKLVIAIVQDADSKALMRALTKDRFGVTKLASTGGFLHSGNTTLLIGVQDDKLDDLLAIIKEHSKERKVFLPAPVSSFTGSIQMPIEVMVGGATVFVLNASDFHKF